MTMPTWKSSAAFPPTTSPSQIITPHAEGKILNYTVYHTDGIGKKIKIIKKNKDSKADCSNLV